MEGRKFPPQDEVNEDFFRRSREEWESMGGLPIPPMPPEKPKPKADPPKKPLPAIPSTGNVLYDRLVRFLSKPDAPAAAPPSDEVLEAIRKRALQYGCDPDAVDRALLNILAAYEPVRRSREPGEDDDLGENDDVSR